VGLLDAAAQRVVGKERKMTDGLERARDEYKRAIKECDEAEKEWQEFKNEILGTSKGLTTETQERRRLLEERLKKAHEKKKEAEDRLRDLFRESSD